MNGIREPRLQRRHQHQVISGVQDETQGSEAIQLCGAASQTRIAEGGAETDSRGAV